MARWLLVLAWSSLAVLGCSADPPPGPASTAATAGAHTDAGSVIQPPDPIGVAIKPLYPNKPNHPINRLLVGRRQTLSTSCPALSIPNASGTWKGRALYPETPDDRLPKGSRGACVFEWHSSSGGAPPRALPKLDAQRVAGLQPGSLVPDPIAMRTLGIPSDLAYTTLRDGFFARLGHAPVSPPVASSAPTPNLDPRVQLVLLDTWPADPAPFPKWVDGRSPHGFNMRWLADSLVGCPVDAKSCPITTRSALALPRGDDGTEDLVQGGYTGTKSDLARALDQVVSVWLRTVPRPKLVINLSVGWEPDANTPEDACGKKDLDAALVHDQLVRATCAGALVIAAAGNTQQEGQGAVCPAQWAAETIACAGVPDALDPRARIPLLHAAAGIDYQGNAAAGHRAGSWTPIVTLSEQAVGFLGQAPPQGILPHTGTSVSAVVLSTIAAREWVMTPNLKANDLVQSIHGKGTPLDSGAGPIAAEVTPRPTHVACVTVNPLPNGQSCAKGGSSPLLPSAAVAPLELDVFGSPLDGGVLDSGVLPAPVGDSVLPQPRTGCGACYLDQRSAAWYMNVQFSAELPATPYVKAELQLNTTTTKVVWLQPTSGTWSLGTAYRFSLGTMSGGAQATRVTLTWSYANQLDSQVIMLAGP